LSAQKSLLSRLLHRDLSDERHKTNLHLHYDVKYPTKFNGVGETEPGSQIPELGPASSKQIEALAESEGHDSRSAQKASFFSYSPTSDMKFCPKDPSIHRPLSISKFFNKSLRWITLGGQYDWTKKVYPGDKPPAFPSDIQNLLNGLFPNMKAQAAIVNLYSPGDTLSLHRDVSEEVDKGLVSISIGCDCLFVIGLGKHPSDTLTIRLRSGDGVYMSKEARFAWHGVPRILPNTCPESLRSWPAGTGEYEEWRDWMSNKRINLNVRQMFED
jgi:alkylated DNA repair protein alkB family protein 1